MGNKKKEGKKVEAIAERMSHHKNLYVGMGYLSLHICHS